MKMDNKIFIVGLIATVLIGTVFISGCVNVPSETDSTDAMTDELLTGNIVYKRTTQCKKDCYDLGEASDMHVSPMPEVDGTHVKCVCRVTAPPGHTDYATGQKYRDVFLWSY